MPTYTPGTESESTRPKLIKPGDYLLCVVGADEKTAASGNEMIELKLEVIGPDIAEDQGPYVWENLVFAPSAFWKIDQFLIAIGSPPPVGKPMEVNGDDLIGCTVKATLRQREWKGTKKMEVVEFIAPTQASGSSAPDDDGRAF